MGITRFLKLLDYNIYTVMISFYVFYELLSKLIFDHRFLKLLDF